MFTSNKPLIVATPGSAGHELLSEIDTIIKPGTRLLIDTGVKIKIPIGYYGDVKPKSRLAMKGIDIGAGVIDSDYTGNIRALLINNGTSDLIIKKNDAIAQLVLSPYVLFSNSIIGSTDLEHTGFGSTDEVVRKINS